MALTQVKTAGLADDAITSAKIADDAVIVDAIAANAVETAQINADAVTGDKIADNTIVEGNMANDAISLAELKAGTDGQIISWDASGNPVAIGPGTDGQVLTSTGAGSPPAFEAVPAGGATINNATENELVTVASTTTQLDAETKLTFDGSKLLLAPRGQQTDPRGYIGVKGEDADVVAYVACGFNAVGNTVGYYFTCHDVAEPRRKAGIVLKKTGDYGKGDIEFWIDQAGDDADVASGDLHTTFENNGDLAINDGNLVMSTAGHGIDFSAQGDDATNMSGELFDDYEEGWFTPTCTNAITLDSYNDRLYYRKIGNTCTIGGRLIVDNGQSGGVLNLGGLPFAHADHGDGTDRTLDHFFFHDWSQLHSNWDDSLCAFYQIHSTNLNLYIRNSSGDWTYFHPYDDGIISFNITYPTT